MAEDWFARCAEIVNMDVTGAPSHVRLVANEPDEVIEEDEFGQCWADPPNFDDNSTDIRRDHELTIHFDAQTDLEAALIVDAITAFVKRRTSAVAPVFITNVPTQGVTP